MLIRETIEPLEFSTREATAIAATSRASLHQYIRRGGGKIRDARPPRYPYRPVLDAMLTRIFVATGLSIEATQGLTRRTGMVAAAILDTMPDVVKIEADPALGADFVVRERARLEDLAAQLQASFLFLPTPMPDDPRPATIYERSETNDLDELLDADAFLGTLVDCEAVAQAFLRRARRFTGDRPLEIRRYAPETSAKGARAA